MNKLLESAKTLVDMWDCDGNFSMVEFVTAFATLRQAVQEAEAKPVSEPVAWAVFLSKELVDLALLEPEFSHDYISKPLYIVPPSIDTLIAEIEALPIEHIFTNDVRINLKGFVAKNDIKTILDKYRRAK